MKKLIFLFVLFITLFSHAQSVYFEDYNFLQTLLASSPTFQIAKDSSGNFFSVDVNNNGEIEEFEAAQVYELYIDNNSISSLLGIEYFTNLRRLNCNYNNLTELDISNLSNLMIVYVNHNNIQSLDITGLSNLEELEAGNNAISSFNYGNNDNLQILYLLDNEISTLTLNNLPSLEEVFISSNILSSLSINDLDNLHAVYANNNAMDTATFINLPSLEILYVYANNLAALDISSCINLEDLVCNNNNLSLLDVSNNNYLNTLDANNNLITEMNVSNLIDLGSLYLDNNRLIDLNIVNTTIGNLTYQYNPNMMTICCDIDNYEHIILKNQVYNYTQVEVNLGENCVPPNKSFVELRFDDDNNGCDENDALLNNYQVQVTSANQNCSFNFLNNYFTYIYSTEDVVTITPVIPSEFFIISPSSIEVDYTLFDEFNTLSFCVTPMDGEFNDVEISIIPIGLARPGFSADYKIIFTNKGNTTLSGNIDFNFEDDYMNYISSTPMANTITTSLLSWDYADLQAFETREILVSFNLNTPIDSEFLLNADDVLSFTTTISPMDTDMTPDDNSSSIQQLVVNSYDPNDKILLEGETILPEMVGEFVHYRIRFENTGTASAVNIRVEDELDPSKFDVSSFKLVDASHEVKAVVENNLVNFIFYNINLPSDDANNDGYVVFKIKTLATLQLNDTFSNTADIYFDYNFPIITNTETTTIAYPLSVKDIVNSSTELKVYPNPVKDSFIIKTDELIKNINVLDMNGRLVQTLIGNQESYNISKLVGGVYVLQFFMENGGNKAVKVLKSK